MSDKQQAQDEQGMCGNSGNSLFNLIEVFIISHDENESPFMVGVVTSPPLMKKFDLV